MSQQAGPSTSTGGGDQASQQQQQTQQQTQQNPFPSTLDFSTQQQLLQQFAAKFPNNLPQLGGGAANPAALFPNLPNLTLPPNRKSSGGSLGGAGSPASNGSNPAPSLNLNLAAAAASGLPGTTPGQVDVQALQAQLQARMLQVQQQALQAAALRAGGAPGSSPAATAGSPANAQASTPGSTTAVQDPTATGAAPVRPVNGIPDWAAQAAASGLLGNIAAGADREAILKQASLVWVPRHNADNHSCKLCISLKLNVQSMPPRLAEQVSTLPLSQQLQPLHRPRSLLRLQQQQVRLHRHQLPSQRARLCRATRCCHQLPLLPQHRRRV